MKYITQPDNAYNQSRVSLDGETYNIETQWIGRTSSWYASLKTGEGAIVFNNVRLVPYVAISRHNYPLMPEGGNIVVQKLNKQTRNPVGRDNLGEDKDYAILYYNINEVSSYEWY